MGSESRKTVTMKRNAQFEDEIPNRSKRTRIDTRSKTPSANAFPNAAKSQIIPISSLTPEQQVINIPHLADKILHFSSLSDVLHWRKVSSHLNASAVRVLEQRRTLHFHNFWLHPRQIGKTLATFNHFVRKRGSDPIHFKRFCFRTFTPKTSLARPRNLDCSIFQTFLKVHGNHISQLSLQVTTDNNPELLKENKMISHIKHLLAMVPNLETLFISHECIVEWVREGKNEMSALTLEDPECIEIHSEQNVICNRKLKVLKLGAAVSSKLCEVILIRAPNLLVVDVVIPWHANYLLQPFSRVHLQTKMFVATIPNIFQMYENVNSQLQIVGGSNVRALAFAVSMSVSLRNHLDEGQMKRFVVIVNQLLELVGETVEDFCWMGVAPLNSLKWPKVMPKVTKIRLQTLCSIRDLMGNRGRLPSQQFRILSKLPQLRAVLFSDFVEEEFFLLANSFGRGVFPGVQDFGYECCVPVSSVKVENQKIIQRLFPNAKTRLIRSDVMNHSFMR